MELVRYHTRGWLLVAALALASVGHAHAADGPNPAGNSPYTLFNSAPLPLRREINALYENPYTVEPGHVQVETFLLQYARGESQMAGTTTTRETWSFGPATVKLGLLNNLDAELVLSPYTHIRFENKATGATTTAAGFGDVVPRLKFNLWGDDGGATALAIVPFVKAPTAARGLGNESVEGGVILPLAVRLPRGWWMVLSPEVECARDVYSSGSHLNLGSTTYFCHQIAGKLSGYADFVFTVSRERGAPWSGVVDFGLSYAVSANSQIDLGLSVGVTAGVDDYNPYVGYSFRF
jgi:hypothetical protein